ncbi:MAG: AI-2E family transporter [Clostridia bacterium]
MFELDKKNMKKIFVIVAFAIVLFLSLQNLNVLGEVIITLLKLITPFIIGFCIAFILNIPVRFIENRILRLNVKSKKKGNKKKTDKFKIKKKNINPLIRITSILISLILIIGIVYFVLFLVIPELITTANIIKDNIPNMVSTVKIGLENMTRDYPGISDKINSFNINWTGIVNTIKGFARSGITGALNSSFSFVVTFISGVINFFIGIIFAVYILTQKEKLICQFKKILYAFIPEKKAYKIVEIGRVINETFSNFIGGQFIESCILGILCFIGMTIFKFPYALTVSVLVGVSSLVPMFGAFIGAIIGALLIVVVSPVMAFWFLVFVIVLQQIEGNLIYPKVVGDSVGLPPIWVLVAVTVGGGTFGIAGMIIGLPAASVIYKLIRKSVHSKLNEKDIKIS